MVIPTGKSGNNAIEPRGNFVSIETNIMNEVLLSIKAAEMSVLTNLSKAIYC